jgi:hypothetical protein
MRPRSNSGWSRRGRRLITLSLQRTKTREGRALPVVGEVAALLERRFNGARPDPGRSQQARGDDNTGHGDARVFDRYDITAVQDQAQALLATEAFRASAAKSDTPSDSRGASA